MSQDNDQKISVDVDSVSFGDNKPLTEDNANAENNVVESDEADIAVTENLTDEDFPEDFSDEAKETIKKVASDDNLSKAKSSASILVEQFIDAKETFNRSLGSLFTSAFTAGLEIGISFFVILSAFTLISDFMPTKYAMVLASLREFPKLCVTAYNPLTGE